MTLKCDSVGLSFRVISSVTDYLSCDLMMSFRYDYNWPDHMVEFYSASGMAYDPTMPRDDTAPPPNKVRRYLLRGTTFQKK